MTFPFVRSYVQTNLLPETQKLSLLNYHLHYSPTAYVNNDEQTHFRAGATNADFILNAELPTAFQYRKRKIALSVSVNYCLESVSP